MQPCGREMRGIPSMASSLSGQIAPPELQNGNQQQQQIQGGGMQGHFDHTSASHDDFFEQMLSSIPSAWPDIGTPKSLWVLGDPNGSAGAEASGGQKPFNMALAGKAPDEVSEGLQYASYDESSLLASRLRQHQISDGGKPMALQINQQHHPAQQQMVLSGGDSGMLPLPLSLGCSGLVDRIRDEGGEGFYNGFSGPLQPAAAQTGSQKHFQHPQNYGASPVGGAAPAAGHGGGSAAPPRQRVRARRGQATDPHSIAERLRRERIAERMKDLQGLVPNANKTDKASMLDEIIDYLKFLQLQVKVLSMSRLGGAAAVAAPPLVADVSSEAGRGGGGGGSESLAVTEHQVAKLMEEDMGSAMQYLQGKGLCLMPISLASAISTATFIPHDANNNNNSPPSPSMSVLTGQSAVANDASKGANSLSRS